jgi:hypothetical protein
VLEHVRKDPEVELLRLEREAASVVLHHRVDPRPRCRDRGRRTADLRAVQRAAEAARAEHPEQRSVPTSDVERARRRQPGACAQAHNVLGLAQRAQRTPASS